MLARIGETTLPCGVPLKVVESPVLDVTSFEHRSDEPKEPLIVDLPAQKVEQDAVIDVVEETKNKSS